MSEVQQVASLHESTVQKIATGEVTARRRRRPPRRLVQPTYQSPLVDARVWAVAKRLLAQDGYTRWEIRDETTVVVR